MDVSHVVFRVLQVADSVNRTFMLGVFFMLYYAELQVRKHKMTEGYAFALHLKSTTLRLTKVILSVTPSLPSS